MEILWIMVICGILASAYLMSELLTGGIVNY